MKNFRLWLLVVASFVVFFPDSICASDISASAGCTQYQFATSAGCRQTAGFTVDVPIVSIVGLGFGFHKEDRNIHDGYFADLHALVQYKITTKLKMYEYVGLEFGLPTDAYGQLVTDLGANGTIIRQRWRVITQNGLPLTSGYSVEKTAGVHRPFAQVGFRQRVVGKFNLEAGLRVAAVRVLEQELVYDPDTGAVTQVRAKRFTAMVPAFFLGIGFTF